MIRERQVVLFRFPQTNQAPGKLRPALAIRKVSGCHGDWLICMISTRLSQEVADFDEMISEEDDDFVPSGLKQASLIRIARLAVVEKNILLGAIGESSDRLVETTGVNKMKQALTRRIGGWRGQFFVLDKWLLRMIDNRQITGTKRLALGLVRDRMNRTCGAKE